MKQSFQNLIKEYQEQDVRLGRTSRGYTTARIVIFLMFLSGWIFLLSESLFIEFTVALLLFPLIFGFLVNKHKKINYRQQFYKHLVIINQEEINRLEFKPLHFYNGSKYKDEDHPYSADLDIYGEKSLYHFINRCATPSGEQVLANWLSKPATKEEIIQRQEAVQELAPDVHWRQQIQATELSIGKGGTMDSFLLWLTQTDNKIHKILQYGLPVLTVALIALWILNFISFFYILVALAINSIVIYRHSKGTQELSVVTDNGLAILKKYRHILNLIEGKKFNSKKLLHIQSYFLGKKYKASDSLRTLERILEFLDARSNAFYHVLNLIFLLDLHLIDKAQAWRKNNKPYTSAWFEAIGELEALCSFAGYKYADASLAFPSISEQPFSFDAKDLGHPLINPSERVNNDFSMKDKGAVYIITGSNMSGKSTFLRTVCINAVLAYAGAPVSASSLQLSIMQVFTSMRTHDDLEAHVSSFYAELKRIKQLLDVLKTEEERIFYVLDEVLKGTNSHDRHAGAIALAKQLHRKNCMGMISTHDLELGALSGESDAIENFSFNSDIVNDKIIFDYKIHPGICKSFNASKLMEQMGIELKNQ